MGRRVWRERPATRLGGGGAAPVAGPPRDADPPPPGGGAPPPRAPHAAKRVPRLAEGEHRSDEPDSLHAPAFEREVRPQFLLATVERVGPAVRLQQRLRRVLEGRLRCIVTDIAIRRSFLRYGSDRHLRPPPARHQRRRYFGRHWSQARRLRA